MHEGLPRVGPYNNRAVQGLDLPRHIKTHAVYNESAPELLNCNEHLNALETCLHKSNYERTNKVTDECSRILLDVNKACGLTRTLYTPDIKIRAIHNK
jgi:hypothetical protein